MENLLGLWIYAILTTIGSIAVIMSLFFWNKLRTHPKICESFVRNVGDEKQVQFQVGMESSMIQFGKKAFTLIIKSECNTCSFLCRIVEKVDDIHSRLMCVYHSM